MENRRKFTRILFSSTASLTIEDTVYHVNIDDISLNGALVTLKHKEDSLKKKLGVLSFALTHDPTNEIEIIMHVAVVHEEGNDIGLQINGIDIDSLSYLRRMIELNLGDEAQLTKELSELSKIH